MDHAGASWKVDERTNSRNVSRIETTMNVERKFWNDLRRDTDSICVENILHGSILLDSRASCTCKSRYRFKVTRAVRHARRNMSRPCLGFLFYLPYERRRKKKRTNPHPLLPIHQIITKISFPW